MAGLLISLAAGLVCTLCTLGFYQLLRVDWPMVYFDIDDGLSRIVSSTLPMFLVYRLVPPALLVAVTVGILQSEKIGYSWAAAISAAVLYTVFAVLTGGRRASKSSGVLRNRYTLWLGISVSVGILGSLLGVILAEVASPALPDVSVLGEALVTAVLIALLVAAGERVKGLYGDGTSKIRKSIEKYSREVQSLVDLSKREEIDPYLMPSIFLAEQLQRPVWFQRLEVVFGRFGVEMTTGPFQVRRGGDSRLSSWTEEIKTYFETSPAVALAKSKSGAASVIQYGGYLDDTFRKMVFALHNDSAVFVDMSLVCYDVLDSGQMDVSVPLVEVGGVTLYCGSANVSHARLGFLEVELYLSGLAQEQWRLDFASPQRSWTETLRIAPAETVVLTLPVHLWVAPLDLDVSVNDHNTAKESIQFSISSNFRARFK